jgi:two-component system sensor histidine kinase UhpB
MGVSSQIESDRRTALDRRAEFGLYTRVFAVNAFILTAAFLLLVFTPFELSSHTTTAQFLILGAGLFVMLAANALLLRLSLAPLRRLTELMTTADLLRPGARLRATGSTEVSAVIGAFNATLERLEAERRSSTQRIVGTQEAERSRIARELHDEIGQNLTAVMLELKRARLQVDPHVAEALGDAQELARESLDELRRISYQLRPAALDDLGLGSALTALCNSLATRTGVTIHCRVPEARLRLTPDEELALYRIAQEALTNAVRHAACTVVTVELRATDQGGVALRVCDDGVGIMTGGQRSGGIRGMRERALMIDAGLFLRNRPNGGLEVEAVLGSDRGG